MIYLYIIFSVELIEELEKLDPAVRTAFLKILRLIEQTIGDIVKKKDFLELKRTVEELSENVKELSKNVRELAEAQKRTEVALRKLTEDHKKTREHLGGLSHTVGYILKNEAYKYLPKFLMEDFEIKIEGRLLRDFIEISDGRFEEINIFGKGTKNGKTLLILGEAKTQLKKSDIDSFLRKVVKLEKIYPEKNF